MLHDKQRTGAHDVAVKAFSVVVSVWLGFFLVTRVAHFFQDYRLESIRQSDHTSFSDMCLSHPELRRLRSADCNRALMLAETSPFWSALFRVFEKTHTCGTVSCSDVVTALLAQTSGLVFYFVLACASALLLYATFSRIVAPMAVSAVRPTIYYDESRYQRIERDYGEYNYASAPRIEEVH